MAQGAGNIGDLPELEDLPTGGATDLPELEEIETGAAGFFLPSDEQEPTGEILESVPPSTTKKKGIDPALLAAVKEPTELKKTTPDYWKQVTPDPPDPKFDYGKGVMSGTTEATSGYAPPTQIDPDVKATLAFPENFYQEGLEALQNDATIVERDMPADTFAKAEGFIKNSILDLSAHIPLAEQSQSFLTLTPDAILPGIAKEQREERSKRIEVALERAESPISWGTAKSIGEGVSGFTRTLDNAMVTLGDLTGMEMGKGWGFLADYIDDFNDFLPDVPNTPIGNAWSDALTIGTQLGLELMITPTFKYARASQLTNGAITGTTPKILNNLARVGLGSAKAENKLFIYTSPKFVTQMGTSNFLNTYGELTKNNPDQLNRSVEAFKAMGYGAFEGAMFTMLGYGSKRSAGYVKRATDSSPLAWSTGIGVNAGGFGAFTATEQLITKGEINWDDVRHSTLTGVALGAVGLPKELFGRAFGNYVMASPLATKTAVENKRSPEDLRDDAFELRRKAELETDIEKAEGLRAEADAIDNFTDIKVINKDVLNNPEGYVDAIEMDTKMSRGDKDLHIDKINKTVLEDNPLVQKADPISKEINRLEEERDGIAENKALDNNVQIAMIAEVNARIQKKQGELAEVFAEKPPAEPKPEEVKEEKPKPTEEELAEEERIATAEQEISEAQAKEELTPEEIEAFETARTEPEYETKDGKYIITRTPTGLDVYNIKTEKAVKPTSAQAKEAIEEYKEAVLPRLQKGKRAEIEPDVVTEEEVAREIIEKSTSPREVAETYLSLVKAKPTEQTLQDAIGEALQEVTITPESFGRAGDPNFITPEIRRAYFPKTGEEAQFKAFDQLVERVKEAGEGRFDELDPVAMEQDIVDFIVQNPKGSKVYFEGKEKLPLVEDLEAKFRELAGFELTREYAERLIEPTELERMTPEEQIEFINKEFQELQKPPIDAEIERFTNRTESEVSESESAVESITSKGENAERLSAEELRDGITEAEGFIRDGGKKPPKEPPVEELGPEEQQGPEDLPIFVDENVGFITDVAAKTKTFFKKFFTPRGLLPKKVFDQKVKMEGRTNAMLNEIKFTSKRFKKGLKEAYGKPTPEQLAEIDRVLKGEAEVSTLPEALQEPVQSMRNQIDALSQRFIDEGLVEGELVGKIQENLGTYLTRSYEVHDNPKWKDKVPAEIKNRAVAFLRSKYPELTDKELEGQINELLDTPDAPLSIIASGKLGAKDLSILKARKDIAPEIRALLGEYSDPLLNYARSITKMSNLISKSKFLTEVEEAGIDDFLFHKPTGKYHRAIAAEGSKTMEPLNGLYTTPEIAEAFEAMGTSEALPAYLRTYMKINGLVKYSKTILSLMTHVRNLVGNTGFAVANGHVRAGKMAPAIKTTITQLAKMEKPEQKEAYKRYQELGVVGESTRAGELQDIIKDASKAEADLEKITDNTATKFLRKGRELANELYQAEDDVWKIYAFENEMARYKKVYPEMDQSELDTKVAEVVRNTYPTYSLVPEAVKQIRRVPLVGTFVSFPAEVVRTSYNTVEQAAKELKDPKTRKIGAERLAGILSVATLTGGAAIATANYYGVTDEEDEAIRRYLPPWSKNSILLSQSAVKNGEYSYIDLGYSDPHTYIKAPVMAMLKGDDLLESGIEAIGEFFEPFLGEELLAARLLDISRNKKESGAEVYNEQATTGDKMADITQHIAEALEPGTSSSFRRIWKGIHGEVNEYGKKYNASDEIIALFSGQRTTTANFSQGFSFKAYRFGQDMGEAKRIYNKVFFSKGEVSPEDLESAYQQANTASENLFNEMVKDYQAALILGVPEKDLKAAMKRNNFSSKMRKSIMSGVYTPLEKKGEKGVKAFEKAKPGGIVGEGGEGIKPIKPGGIVP